MKLRWTRRYKVSHTGSDNKSGQANHYLSADLVLQEMVKVKDFGGKITEEWSDLEIFDDLETKEKAIEDLQKLGVFIPLKMK